MLPAAGVEPQAVNTMAQVSPIEANYEQQRQEPGHWLPVQHGAAGNSVGLAEGSSGSLPVGNGMAGLGNGPVVTPQLSPQNVTSDFPTGDQKSLVTSSENVPSDFVDSVEVTTELPVEKSLVTFGENVPSDAEVTEDDLSPEIAGDFLLNEAKLFEVAECGCYLPKWKSIEWRKQEEGHRYLRCVGSGLSVNGKPTKRRKYGKWFTHRALTLFVEEEYEQELEVFRQRQSFGQSKRRAKA